MTSIEDFFKQREEAIKIVKKIDSLKNDFDKLTDEQKKMLKNSIIFYENELIASGYYKLLVFLKVIINDLNTYDHEKWLLNCFTGGGEEVKNNN